MISGNSPDLRSAPSHEAGGFLTPTCVSVCRRFSRCHLIGLLRGYVTGGQLREESREPVLRFSGRLRVQPSQPLFQQVVLRKPEWRSSVVSVSAHNHIFQSGNTVEKDNGATQLGNLYFQAVYNN